LVSSEVRIDGSTRPSLPTAESKGIYRRDPRLRHAGTATMSIGSKDRRLKDVGADAYEPRRGSREKRTRGRR